MKKLLVTLVVLVGLAVVADRVTVHIAENQVAEQIQTQGDLSGPPSVDITGFPFLTQAVAGRYDDVRISLTAADLGQPAGTSAAVSLHGVQLPLSDVLSGSVQQVPIDRLDGTATLSYDLLSRQLGGDARLRPEGDGLRITKTVEVAGYTLPLSATGTVHLEGQQLLVDVQKASAVGVQVPDFVVQQASELLDLRYDIPPLPFGLRLAGVRIEQDGVHVAVAAKGVVLHR